MSEGAIEIKDLRVDYGDFVAVKDISLSVPYGEVFGLVGPNGAGKTSTFRVLATLMEPTYGEVSLAGIDILENTERAREVIGYMPDLAPVPSDLKLWEFLDFHADTHRLGDKKRRRERVDECLDIVNLTAKENSWCKELSRGQTQRLVLAKTLLHRPRVMILDEPASGLDPLSRREMRHALQRLAQGGATVLVSSHILTELAEMCSLLCVMNEGNLLASGTAEHVREQLGRKERTVRATFVKVNDEIKEWLKCDSRVSGIREDGPELSFDFVGNEDDQVALLSGLAAGGFGLKSFEEDGSSFEDILVEVAEGNRES
ncbi:ABC transporter ATP-binding protein [Akkermansiaceae bacterium]|nr:ABC transporter ATP-binding protein [Akkermansiaceae bacterium]